MQQHQFNLGIDSAKFLFHPMAHISPNVTHQPLPYHEVSAARLPSVTSDGLQGAGIPIEALGLRVDRKHVLTSCFTLSAYAREQMPTSLGGTNEVAETRLGPVSTHFLEAVSAASPILRLSPAGSPYKPVAPVERRLSPPAAAEEPMLGPTTRSRHATIEAMAAHGKSKSGAKKKRQAAKRKKARGAAE